MSDLADSHIREHAQIQNKPRSVERSRRIWDRWVLPKLGKRRVRESPRRRFPGVLGFAAQAAQGQVQTQAAGAVSGLPFVAAHELDLGLRLADR